MMKSSGETVYRDDNYNEYMLGLLRPGKLNVLTIHAEVEGIVCLDMFEQYVKKALSLGHCFVPLGDLLQDSGPIGTARIEAATIPGARDGSLVRCRSDVLGRQIPWIRDRRWPSVLPGSPGARRGTLC